MGDPAKSNESEAASDIDGDLPAPQRGWLAKLIRIGSQPQPLQDETTTFILVNVLDLFVTHILLSIGGSEANPIARFFLDRWGFIGMIAFTMAIIAFFCVVTLLIAQYNHQKAKRLMRFGTIVVVCVVFYGVTLIFSQLL